MAFEAHEIVDQSTHEEKIFVLYVGDGPRATLRKRPGFPVELHWEVYGPQYWPKARPLIQGLLELTLIADELDGGQSRQTNEE